VGHTGKPLKRTWVDCPYGEEELLPALDAFLSRIDELDERLLAQQESLKRCLLGSRSLGSREAQGQAVVSTIGHGTVQHWSRAAAIFGRSSGVRSASDDRP
jgi:hypothetical protein